MGVLRLLGLVAILASGTGILGVSAGKEIRVPQDYKTIQQAVDAADEGDTILVDVGTYPENLRIAKGLTLIGADRERTIIDGRGSRVLDISGTALVTVRNFTITNGQDGVFIGRGAQALVQATRIEQNGRDGVLVAGSAQLRGNLIRKNGRCGVQTFGADAQVTGSGNIIQGNAGGDLCGNVPSSLKAEGGPPPPQLQVTPNAWTNKNEFTLDWENPDYPAAIVAAWYKIGSAPASAEDGARVGAAQKPLRLQSPGEGSQPVWLWLEDELGQKNHQNAAQAQLRLDQTPPQIAATLDPQPNANGWNNSEVTVRFRCADALSGVASCTPEQPVRFPTEGKGQTARAQALDNAGNRAELTVTVNIDMTKPQIALGSPQGTLGKEGWYLSDVTVPFTATDNLAGFAPEGRLTLEGSRRSSGEGPAIKVAISVADLAGNSVEAEAGPFKVDKTPPQGRIVLDPASPNGRNGWYVSPVKVHYECSDTVSGLVPGSCPSDQTLTQDGTHTLRATIRDQAGNESQLSQTVNLDRTPPQVSCRPPDTTPWYNRDVEVPCTASDATSGLASSADAQFKLVAWGEGSQVATDSRTVRDMAGNATTAGPYTFKIDRTPPSIDYELTPRPNANGWNNSDVTVRFRCADALSGLVSCTPEQQQLSREGEQRVEGRAEDRAGNVRTTSVTVRIDKTPPTGSLTINDGAEIALSTTVTLRLSAQDALSGVAEMRFSNDGQSWSDWESFRREREWNLTRFGGNSSVGLKTVYAQVRDRAGNVSQAFRATIRLAVATLTGHTRNVWSVAFSPDGRLLASGSNDNTIKLWEVASGREVRILTGHSGAVFSVAFSPDGRLLASGSYDTTIKLWEVATGNLVRTLSGHTHWVNSVAFSPDGRLLASGSYDTTIKLWEVATGNLVRTLRGHGESVYYVAFSPDGRLLASGSWDDTIKLWEVATGREVRTLFGGGVTPVAFSPDGRLLASGSWQEIKLWEVATGNLVRTLTGHTGPVYSVAFSPDGRLLASAGSTDKTIKLWEVATGREVRTLRGHGDSVYSVAFSPDGRLLASASRDTTIKLWDLSAILGR
jgi:WD40 repeat protein